MDPYGSQYRNAVKCNVRHSPIGRMTWIAPADSGRGYIDGNDVGDLTQQQVLSHGWGLKSVLPQAKCECEG